MKCCCRLIYGSLLCGPNAFAGVDFKRMLLNTFASLEKFLSHKALVIRLFGEVCIFQSHLSSLSLSDKNSQKLLGGRQAGTVTDPSTQGILVWRFWGDSVRSVPKAPRIFLELSCQS